MAKNEPYRYYSRELYSLKYKRLTWLGAHRPSSGQGLPTNLHVECLKSLSRNYPVGTRFRIKAKLTDREGSHGLVYFGWRYEVLS